jgi:hypothetical protein
MDCLNTVLTCVLKLSTLKNPDISTWPTTATELYGRGKEAIIGWATDLEKDLAYFDPSELSCDVSSWIKNSPASTLFRFLVQQDRKTNATKQRILLPSFSSQDFMCLDVC